MFFLFFYYIFNILISKFSKKFYVNYIIKKIFIYITKVIIYFLNSIIFSSILPKITIKIIVWILSTVFFYFLVLKLNCCISLFLNYAVDFKIKYQLFNFIDKKFDPYSILKISDFLLFYPIFYIYYYFFNDLTFSFQRVYYWLIYKINNFGISQNKRSNFMRNWTYGSTKSEAGKKPFTFQSYHNILDVFKKSAKISFGKTAYVVNFPYYIFFTLIVLVLIYLVYRVYFKDLKPIRYNMDDSVRFDFFGSLSDQTVKIEINDFFFEELEKKIFKINRYPLEYINNPDPNNLETEQNHLAEEENSFDLIMNKFGVDGMSYLDELHNNEKNQKSFSSFSYISFIIYFFKDLVENIYVLLEYQIKFNIILNLKKKFLINSKHNYYKKNLKISERIFYLFYFFFFIVFFIYFFIILFTFLFLFIDFSLLSILQLFYSIPSMNNDVQYLLKFIN